MLKILEASENLWVRGWLIEIARAEMELTMPPAGGTAHR